MPEINENMDQQKLMAVIKPMRVFQLVRIEHHYFIRLQSLNIKEYQNQNKLISRCIKIKFSLKTVRGAAIVRDHDLYDCYGSYADKRYCLHPLDYPIRRIHFHLSYWVSRQRCREQLASYSGNLCRAIVHYYLLKSELCKKQLETFL